MSAFMTVSWREEIQDGALDVDGVLGVTALAVGTAADVTAGLPMPFPEIPDN
jgi:hypothetical protein